MASSVRGKLEEVVPKTPYDEDEEILADLHAKIVQFNDTLNKVVVNASRYVYDIRPFSETPSESSSAEEAETAEAQAPSAAHPVPSASIPLLESAS